MCRSRMTFIYLILRFTCSSKSCCSPFCCREDAETIVERDYSGDSRRINRLVFDEQESLAMQEASKLPEKELRERAYQKYQEKIKAILSGANCSSGT